MEKEIKSLSDINVKVGGMIMPHSYFTCLMWFMGFVAGIIVGNF